MIALGNFVLHETCTNSVVTVPSRYPLNNYSVRNNDNEDPPRLCEYKMSLKLREDYENDGMIRTIMAVLLGHQNSIVHVLLLKSGVGQTQMSKLYVMLFFCSNTNFNFAKISYHIKNTYAVLTCRPTLTLLPGEDEIDGMKRLLIQV